MALSKFSFFNGALRLQGHTVPSRRARASLVLKGNRLEETGFNTLLEGHPVFIEKYPLEFRGGVIELDGIEFGSITASRTMRITGFSGKTRIECIPDLHLPGYMNRGLENFSRRFDGDNKGE